MQYQPINKAKKSAMSNSRIYYGGHSTHNVSSMNRYIAILSYITLVGWLAAMFIHGSHKSYFARFHLRQSLGLIITAALLLLVPLVGWVLNLLVLIIWVHSIYHVIQGHMIKAPILGNFYQKHLDFIK